MMKNIVIGGFFGVLLALLLPNWLLALLGFPVMLATAVLALGLLARSLCASLNRCAISARLREVSR